MERFKELNFSSLSAASVQNGNNTARTLLRKHRYFNRRVRDKTVGDRLRRVFASFSVVADTAHLVPQFLTFM